MAIPSSVDTTTSTPAPILSSISLFSNKINFPIGETATLKVIGYYSDGSITDITTSANFTSSDESKVSLSGETATAISSGATTITASLEGKSKSLVLIPFSATITSIELNFTSLTLPLVGDSTLYVSAIYENGQSLDVSDSAVYSIADESVATILNKKISAENPGTTTLTVDYAGFTKSLPITITSAAISSIQVSPIIGSKASGSEQQFMATASLDDGSTLDITESADWNSSNTSLISIDSSALGVLKSSGVATITASYQGFSSSVNFEVLDKTISSIDLVLSTQTVSNGVSLTASCVATYSDSSTLDITESVNFQSSDNNIAFISNNPSSKGQISTLSVGSVDITADISGVTSIKTLTITAASLSSITVTTKSSLLSAGINAYFQATGTFDDGSTVDLTQNVNWSVSNSSYGSISNSSIKRGLYSNSFSGASTSSLIVSASMNGVIGSQTIILAPGTITSISINPSTATLNTNQNLDYKAYAHFSDGASVEITDIVTWVSSDTSIGMISNAKSDAGRFSALLEGQTSLQANYKGLSSTLSLIAVDNSQSTSVPEEGTGLLASYYSGRNFDTFKGQRIDSQVNFNWATGQAPLGVGDNFSVRWTGFIKGKYTGNCTIASRSDDGFRAYIGGNTILNIWTNHAPRWDYNYSVSFVEGEKQEITVEFYENGGHAVSELYWECPGDSGLEAIPMEFLFPN